MSTFEFSETPEAFERDYAASWALFGQVFITNAAGWDKPIVLDPSRIVILGQNGATP